MKPRRHVKAFDHSGSSFASFLAEESIQDEVESIAVKRILAWQLEEAMRKRQKTKQAMAKELRTSRSQLDRLLDPRNVSVSLHTITRAANALGKKVIIRIADAKPARTGRSSRFTRRSAYAARRASADALRSQGQRPRLVET
jgi:antitoxin HicB